MRQWFHATAALLFVAPLIWAVSFLGTGQAYASPLGDPAIAEGPVCNTAEQVKFLVTETEHHGKLNAVAASAEFYGDKACMYATSAFVREADDFMYLITDKAVTISAITVYGFQIDNHWIKVRPPMELYTAFVEKAVGVSSDGAKPILRIPDEWSNGIPVPAWVKSSCCGPEDVHHLTAKQVHAMADGWHVEGYNQTIAYGRELPSQDGDYWVFYRDFFDGGQTPVYCFFAPAQSF